LNDWTIVNIEPAAGNSQDAITYSFVDRGFTQGRINYYRLIQTDLDGTSEVFTKLVSIDDSKLNVQLVSIVNLLGQEISEDTRGVQIRVYSDGTTEKVFKQ
jgi:hypothetical protein